VWDAVDSFKFQPVHQKKEELLKEQIYKEKGKEVVGDR